MRNLILIVEQKKLAHHGREFFFSLKFLISLFTSAIQSNSFQILPILVQDVI
jgi:hypothetical protein